MFKLILAALLLLSGSVLLILAARRFESVKINLALGLTSMLFLGQGTLMIGQVRSRVQAQAPAPQASASSASASPEAPADWDQGGTLQNATLDKWRMGDYSDRLASAADLLKSLREQRLFNASIRSEQDYRPWAVALVACLEAGQAEYSTPVRQLAARCLEGEGLRRYM